MAGQERYPNIFNIVSGCFAGALTGTPVGAFARDFAMSATNSYAAADNIGWGAAILTTLAVSGAAMVGGARAGLFQKHDIQGLLDL